jgi:hypothetical protein
MDAGADLAGIVLAQVDLKRQAQYRYGGDAYNSYYNSAYQKKGLSQITRIISV